MMMHDECALSAYSSTVYHRRVWPSNPRRYGVTLWLILGSRRAGAVSCEREPEQPARAARNPVWLAVLALPGVIPPTEVVCLCYFGSQTHGFACIY